MLGIGIGIGIGGGHDSFSSLLSVAQHQRSAILPPTPAEAAAILSTPEKAKQVLRLLPLGVLDALADAILPITQEALSALLTERVRAFLDDTGSQLTPPNALGWRCGPVADTNAVVLTITDTDPLGFTVEVHDTPPPSHRPANGNLRLTAWRSLSGGATSPRTTGTPRAGRPVR
ncbi:hypothetical protein [Streptomyces sp. NPDC014006]|uniref:hypothetical protein n=1 Tax=Streptomyces sp. NPDC014006 TaxID=3364870 RepID=UPI0036F8A312